MVSNDASGTTREVCLQLLIQFDAVANDAPRARDDTGNTSPGRTQATGPKLVPYAAVKMYTKLRGGSQQSSCRSRWRTHATHVQAAAGYVANESWNSYTIIAMTRCESAIIALPPRRSGFRPERRKSDRLAWDDIGRRAQSVNVEDGRYDSEKLYDADPSRNNQPHLIAFQPDALHKRRSIVQQSVDPTPFCDKRET